jgi:microcompartment protein CcmL/EutN
MVIIVWFWRLLYVMACHVAIHITLHGDTRVSDNVIPRPHHETKKEAARPSSKRNLSSKFRNHLISVHANSIISVYNNNKDSYCM